MEAILWVIAVILVIVGIVQIVQGQIALGIVLIVVGLLVGPGGVSLFAATPAGASALQSGDLEPDAPIGAWFTLSNTLVVLLTGSLIPFAVSFLANPANPSWWKLALVAVLSEVGNLIQNAIQDDGTAVFSQEHAVQLIAIVATALFTYARIWNPLAKDATGRGLNAATGPGVLRTDRAVHDRSWVRD